jgi:transcription elongation factor Elf1
MTTKHEELRKLEACPFCGHQPRWFDAFTWTLSFWRSGWNIDCAKCGASGPRRVTRIRAIDAWSIRASDTAKILELLDEIKLLHERHRFDNAFLAKKEEEINEQRRLLERALGGLDGYWVTTDEGKPVFYAITAHLRQHEGEAK